MSRLHGLWAQPKEDLCAVSRCVSLATRRWQNRCNPNPALWWAGLFEGNVAMSHETSREAHKLGHQLAESVERVKELERLLHDANRQLRLQGVRKPQSQPSRDRRIDLDLLLGLGSGSG